MKLTVRMMRILKTLEDGKWREVEGCFNSIFALNPLLEIGCIETRYVGGMGADWDEYRITPLGKKALGQS